MSASRFVLLLSLLNTFLFNGALYLFIAERLDLYTLSGLLIATSVTVVVFVVNLILLSLISLIHPILLKLFFSITAAINAIALYYLVTYQVILDRSMMGNIFNTRSSESLELLSPTLLFYFFLLAVVPVFFILKVKVQPSNRLRIIINAVIFLILSVLFLYLNATSWLWIDKHAKLLGGKILPWSYLINSYRHFSSVSKSSESQILLPDGTFTDNGKTVVILVIGETARSANFSLYGYARKTNPLLASENLLVFNKANSCTTYTTGSLACMLSHDINAKNHEPLPSYLNRHGVNVIWRTNNWGEPPIQVAKYQTSKELRNQCQGDQCDFDEFLLAGITKEIQASAQDKILIVLHTKGSHGPSYYSRYPSAFEQFTPVCRSEELSKCTQQELINAYDNTILYTDFFLHKTIQTLKQLKDTPSMLIYASDHGESLGEKGLYLHGTPFMFAPKYQKEIPFIIWRSDDMIEQQAIANAEIKQSGAFSHKNIFHTVIGAFNFKTDVYESGLDVLQKNE